MTKPSFRHPCGPAALTATLLLAASAGAMAQSADGTRSTLELTGSHGTLSAGLPDAQALNVRGTWNFSGGDVLRAEALAERKFGSNGSIVAAGYTRVLSTDWLLSGTLALGHGGPNWARQRADVEVSAKWGAARNIVTRAAVYHARYDASRSDSGLRLSAVLYTAVPLVLEAGLIVNVSDPGRVSSRMPFASATYGSEGVQYLSARASAGTEAYQAISAGQQLVDFRSRSLGLNWRRWMGRQWGFIVQAETYHNPSYERTTFGLGAFSQW